jgi:phospholipid-binding lipoprotein MlaA
MAGRCAVRLAVRLVSPDLRPLAAAAFIVLGGCASQTVQFHRLPPDTPAADNAAEVAKMQKLAAAAALAQRVARAQDTGAQSAAAGTAPEGTPAEGTPAGEAPPPPVTPAEAPPMRTYDPWGRLNRFTYRFNARFDEALFLPVANDYRRLLPSPIRTGVHNFFGNVAEIDSFINYALQGRLGRMVRSVGRFVVNSTIGIGGLFDPATKLRLEKAPTGFGTTLAKWGMHPGPYLVIPFLGPSTVREGIGLAADYGTLYVIDPAWIYRGDQSWGLGVVNAVDRRSTIDFRYYSSGSPFEYETIQFLYVRKELIEDAGLHRHERMPKTDPNVPAGE